MVGFEDAVNMVEETKEPIRIFPKARLFGLGVEAMKVVHPALAGETGGC
jgi:amino acid transporter